jgi:hypothetical protein
MASHLQSPFSGDCVELYAFGDGNLGGSEASCASKGATNSGYESHSASEESHDNEENKLHLDERRTMTCKFRLVKTS